jgi:hypothetical protein
MTGRVKVGKVKYFGWSHRGHNGVKKSGLTDRVIWKQEGERFMAMEQVSKRSQGLGWLTRRFGGREVKGSM